MGFDNFTISKISPKIFGFLEKRLIELAGIILILLSIFFFVSLASYSPADPNFIYSEKGDIKNIFGFSGSVVSDFILQSIGLMGFLFSLNVLIWGINIVLFKNFSSFLQKVFFSIIYILSGTSAIHIYKDHSFWLFDNGNGGFIGRSVSDLILNNINFLDNNYIIIILSLVTVFLFFTSITLKIKHIIKFIKIIFFTVSKFFLIFSRKKNDMPTKINVTEDKENKNINTQPGLPFAQKKENFVKNKKFILPPINFLNENIDRKNIQKTNEYSNKENSQLLEKILLDFGVQGKIKRISHGPVVTLNEFEPAPGIKVSKIINLSDDIARNTSSISTRVSTIPGKNTVGIEIPNLKREDVFLNEVISDKKFEDQDIKLPIALGKSISGNAVIGDLSTMPHLLIAGTTGSGKSVCINTIIISLLYRHSMERCKFILIDPKMLELSSYEGIPHLLSPVITEAKKATAALGWVVKEMQNRYKKMTIEGVRDIGGYNKKNKNIMPYIVVIVDEMSDLMLVAGKEIENYIQKLSQMARAAGIHIIMATQRPSVDVITGTIKANFPTRISFQVSSKIDSRTILGEQGAEQLLGKGDMLFMSSANKIFRIHGPFVSETEIEKINSFLRSQSEPEYIEEITSFDDKQNIESNYSDDKKDELYLKAIELVKSEGKASTSFLQRKLQIGYNRAARIIDMMEEDKIVGKANHVGKREIL